MTAQSGKRYDNVCLIFYIWLYINCNYKTLTDEPVFVSKPLTAGCGSSLLGLLNSSTWGSGLWTMKWSQPGLCWTPRFLHSVSVIRWDFGTKRAMSDGRITCLKRFKEVYDFWIQMKVSLRISIEFGLFNLDYEDISWGKGPYPD